MNVKSKSHQYHTYTCHSNYSHIILHNSTMTIQIIHFTDINIVHALLFTLQKSLFASWMINSFDLILKLSKFIHLTEINIVHCITHVTKPIRYSIMNDQLIPFNLRNIIIIYSSTEYPTEKQDTTIWKQHTVQHEIQLRSSGEERWE